MELWDARDKTLIRGEAKVPNGWYIFVNAKRQK